MNTSPITPKPDLGKVEFIALMAAMAALDAFSIDAMLPALAHIDNDLGLQNENHRQYIITTLFLGFATGVLIYGFIADQFGRKGPALAGFGIYILGSLSCIFAESFGMLLLGRLFQGLGAAGPYVLSVAIVRDKYQGREMAQILSLIMMIFIGVPIIAPFVGQGILLFTGWRSIFVILALFAISTMLWFMLRQSETLAAEDRVTLSPQTIGSSVKEILTHPQTLSYLLGMGAVFGAFMVYLSTGQQVFQEIYTLGEKFPIAFASLAMTFGIASWFNSRWVESIGSVRLIHRALSVIVITSLLFLALSLTWGSAPPLGSYMVYMAVVIFSFGMLFGNMTSLALEPMGHIAGSASSVVNSLSTLIAMVLATLIGSRLDTNVYPIVTGFGFLAAVAWVLNLRVMRSRTR